MRLADGGAIEIMIADLTRDGCRILTDSVIARDAACRIGIANVGLTPGRLVWQGPDGYGCAFDSPLPPGAITAAFGGSNVAVLSAHLEQPPQPQPAAKLPQPLRALAVSALIVGGWGLVIGAFAIAL